MREKIVIIGAGGHAKTVAECIDRCKYEIVGYLDKDESCVGEVLNHIPVIGDDSQPERWKQNGITGCIIGVGHVGTYGLRNRLFQLFREAGYRMVTAIHPASILAPTVVIGQGAVVMSGAILQPDVTIGENAIINTGAIIEHDAVIGDGAHIAPGSIVCGGTVIGENTLIGAGSTVLQGKTIGKNVIIGAGAVVLEDVPDHVTVVGNPARIVKERME